MAGRCADSPGPAAGGFFLMHQQANANYRRSSSVRPSNSRPTFATVA